MEHLPPASYLRNAARQYGDSPALSDGARTLDYRTLLQRAEDQAPPGGRPGRVHVVSGSPGIQMIVELWAAWGQGLAVEVGSPSTAQSGPADSARSTDVVVARVATSGSGGRRRIVPISAAMVGAAVSASARRLGNTKDDVWLLCLPLTHVAGLSILWRAAAAAGSVLVHSGFDVNRVAATLHDGGVQWVSMVPTMLRRLLDEDEGPYPDTVRGVLLGGAAADRSLVERAIAARLPVLVTYGMTETCSQIATVAPGDSAAALGTVGEPLPGVEVAIVSEDGGHLPQRREGDIVVDGPTVFTGYLDDEARRGPFRTGDRGYLDVSGRLVVTGRADDLIVTGGENVQPLEVEEILRQHPDVADAAVWGVPDQEWGHRVVAAVVLSADVAEHELVDHVNAKAPSFKVPKSWVFVDELPLLPNGKVDRDAVRAERGRR